ncbi:MAG: hypothetical protein II984_01315 [Clostridia bacterium]|nr:hypothetical protein [Clostridia bacterium]
MKEILEKIFDKFKLADEFVKIYCFKNAVGYKVFTSLFYVSFLLYEEEIENGTTYYIFEAQKVNNNYPNLKTKIVNSSPNLLFLQEDIKNILLFLGFEKKVDR